MKHWVGLMKIGFWVCCIPYGEVYAKNLGTQGAMYEIGEQDALLLIEQRVKQMEQIGEIERQQQKLKSQMIASIEKPTPVLGLKRTEKPRTFEHDLTVTVPADMIGPKGEVIYKAGARINPLAHVFTSKTVVFLDGEDEQQLAWALEAYKVKNGLAKLVLVNGSPLALMRQYEIPFYFDQGGRLSQYFKLEQIPARVYQEKEKLIIEELKL